MYFLKMKNKAFQSYVGKCRYILHLASCMYNVPKELKNPNIQKTINNGKPASAIYCRNKLQ